MLESNREQGSSKVGTRGGNVGSMPTQYQVAKIDAQQVRRRSVVCIKLPQCSHEQDVGEWTRRGHWFWKMNAVVPLNMESLKNIKNINERCGRHVQSFRGLTALEKSTESKQWAATVASKYSKGIHSVRGGEGHFCPGVLRIPDWCR